MDAATAYRRSAAHQASPLRLVVLLYEQLVKDLQRAVACVESNDTEGRTQEIDHALAVVCQLQGTLDNERGGDVAVGLEQFYDLLRYSLLEAQVHVSKEILQKQIANLLILRDAWTEVERIQTSAPPAASPRASAKSSETVGPAHAGWKG